MANAIETHDLTRRFGSFTAVDRINVQVREGEIYGFLGANGAGKTTAIRMLCGLLAPTAGSGHVAGLDIMRQTAEIRTRIGYMSQKFSLYPDLTMLDNLRLYGALYGLKRRKIAARIAELGEFLGMSELLGRRTGELPWGWQQRVSLACANLHRPAILFLDEPTGSVDPLSRRRFWELIQLLSQQGTTIFVTTHHMDEAEYCDRVSLMAAGAIVVVDSPAALKKRFGCSSLGEAFVRALERTDTPGGSA
jgi:ABC-2 type transport system ATP-binding protein